MASNPYASLEPDGRRDRTPLYPEVGATAVAVRGLRKRCPRCGERDTFVGWFQMRMTCPRCDLRFAREEGGFLGAMTLNYATAIGVWIVVIGIALWFYPRSRMLWAAVEFLVLRSDPDYRAPVARDPRSRDLE